MKQWQKYAAELLGTFVLVFVGSVAILDGGGIVGIAFGFGLALLAGLYAFGEVSGGHFNPIVSLAMFLDRRLTATETVWYWAAQFVGAICASLVVLAAFKSRTAVGNTATVSPDKWTGWVCELVASAIFVAVILQVTKSDKYGVSTLIAIPLTLVAIHMALITISGSSVNPARSFAPVLVSAQHWSDIWIYFTAPPIGAVVGFIAHLVTVQGDTAIRGDLARAATDMRSVSVSREGLREGPGQVPPPEPPEAPPASTPDA
jgi:aquaporin Z